MAKVRLLLVGGFLGAGKTTALVWLARSLEALGNRCAVVLNDQGEGLVDTAFARANDLPVSEVTGGCFCCRFDDLTATTIELVGRTGAEIVLAEAVGSCTDLTATVIRPLEAYFGETFTVAPLMVFVEPLRLREIRGTHGAAGVLIPYLFDKQLEDAQLIVLNKVDLLEAAERAELVSALEQSFVNPRVDVLCVSARTGHGMKELRDRLVLTPDHQSSSGLRSIDYAEYARAEAELAWLNAYVTVMAGGNPPPASAEWLREFTSELSNGCVRRGLWIGHVKAHMATPGGASKVSVLRAGEAASFDFADPRPFVEGRLLVNARVRSRPADLDAVVLASLARVDEQLQTTSTVESLRSFSPPPPRPTHRFAAS